MSKRKYDFAGWVTKNDILCTDGVIIKSDAFSGNDGKQVPLVWNHDYNNPRNILGHIDLKNSQNGVYGYGYFNNSEEGRSAAELIRHGDISSMSIGARKIKRVGPNVVHGDIYEVSLVLAGANPGAKIETTIAHSDDGTEQAIIYTGNLIHSVDDILPEDTPLNNEEGEELMQKDKTVGDILETLDEEQVSAVQALIQAVVDEYEDLDEDEDDNEEEEGDDENMHQNAFSRDIENEDEILRHSSEEALREAIRIGASSFRQVLQDSVDDTLTHGINSVEMLFPEAAHPTNGNEPLLYKDPNTAYRTILNGMTKSPFSKVRTLLADMTEEEARAKGYIKGDMKKEQYFSLIKRSTSPTTVYKKQKIDRDDVVDITDFNVVAFMNREMRMMLEEEVARAALVGDGRDVAGDDKINEQNIRPIITDHEFFTIQKTYTDAEDFIETLIKAFPEYRGSGNPTLFIDPMLLADIKLLKGTDGRYLFGDIPSNNAIAVRLGVAEIVPTTFMSGKGALVVNLKDYTLGATNGGQITNFDDFDIDFNQYKYLIETRLSGALTLPKSAIHLSEEEVVGADAITAGIVMGSRSASSTSSTSSTSTTPEE